MVLLLPGILRAEDQCQPVLQDFYSAYHAGDYDKAHNRLARLWTYCPDKISDVLEQADKIYQYRMEQLPSSHLPSITDTLILLCEQGVRHAASREARDYWQQKMLLHMQRYPELYADESQRELDLFVKNNRWKTSLPILEQWFDSRLNRFSTRRISFYELASSWTQADYDLNLKILAGETEAAEIRTTFKEDMAAAFLNQPDLFAAGYAQNPRICELQLMAVVLQDSVSSYDCDEILRNFIETEHQSEWSFLAFFQAMKSGNYALADDLLMKAFEGKQDELETTIFLYLKAGVLAKLEHFEASLQMYEASARQMPGWGLPWLQSADLILDTAPLCMYEPFDRKALYWLAIDYCLKARNADPALEEICAEKMFSYQQQTPTEEELKFRHLNAGDKYPLHCWFDKVVTVRIY